MGPMTSARSDQALGRAAEHAAWAFYAVAALGSSIGQVWVGVETPPWSDTMPLWLRAILALPFAVVIDLGGVVCSGFADTRQRLGENAYGWRILSAGSVTLAVGINVVGHAGSPYLATVFGGLGIFAYCVWLLHSSARRRDALRVAGKLSATPPAYGLLQWWREPAVTRRAKSLAVQFGCSLHESLAEARVQLRTEARRAALASHIEAKIRSRHDTDPVLASIAATTTPVDDIADALMAMIDTIGWAAAIAAEIQPPDAAQPAPTQAAHRIGAGLVDTSRPPSTAVLRQIPTQQSVYDRWREIWQAMTDDDGASNQDIAARFDVSSRTVQRIRDAGLAGLLDSPETPVARIAALASSNGHTPLPAPS
ncbi:hypothetical protein [Jidongwangia harbinensis]|uniref:hypothetical protein n=1 Tax=Jidongwangia harbinensis TaxID=2878561 RepID=UPI001CD9826E|nr:hypothetical protein [Jidongwangia harbinensis]MCA2216339.1 hypothetical protein [Jidongwangia harbinensis]MCA2217074.1 hypothetical protein [Jidongwangia harbinensis]